MIDSVREIWDGLTKPIGQLITSATTFSISAANYFNSPAFDVYLSKIGMICGIGVSLSLIALNVLKFTKEWRNKS